jgi:hypothetical protein
MGDDQGWRAVPVEQSGERVGDRGEPPTAVDQNRDPALRCEREHGLEAWVVGEEPLCARVELDAAGAEVDAACRLLDGAFVEIEPHERQELGRRRGGVRECPVVCRRERRPAVGLVQTEDERAVDAVRALDREQLVPVAGHPVDVLAEMRVGVEDAGVARQLGSRESGVVLE